MKRDTIEGLKIAGGASGIAFGILDLAHHADDKFNVARVVGESVLIVGGTALLTNGVADYVDDVVKERTAMLAEVCKEVADKKLKES